MVVVRKGAEVGGGGGVRLQTDEIVGAEMRFAVEQDALRRAEANERLKHSAHLR